MQGPTIGPISGLTRLAAHLGTRTRLPTLDLAMPYPPDRSISTVAGARQTAPIDGAPG